MPQGYWVFPHIDPVIFSIGIFDVRWYGLMYLLGLAFAYWWGGKQAERLPNWNKDQFGDLLFWCFVGVILGGRIGYVLFYHLDYFLADPLYIFDIQHGGMSFHGGLLGVITAMFLYAWRHNRKFLAVGDFIAPLVPVGLMFGRFGNFINGELWGRPTDVPWAVIFPSGGPIPRHPSQLYEAGLEGIALFFLLYWFTRKPRPTGAVGGLFLIGYGVARFTVEFFREPDAHLGLLSLGMSMGQWLTLPMIILGVALIGWAYYRQPNQQSKEMS
ncbi:prolipoprotein diacylglyceryl transferase [Idiomarina tyrosinivorans]|uniref:Phosphatidylglycerol--prolipoprotein diacylglyceryl transferase n=1 Tax=Idiomarina tyrosinivorans TaxID=1445662 RepID=A0A432ZQX8_9GAMM|nr:prolipoprotein diacylglyceryl transferase [Idiomarina tyrosinivorans]RUO80335.1 prolipoprotein diacylglyceryl transferase [Idiomarina tyrosinivorans]